MRGWGGIIAATRRLLCVYVGDASLSYLILGKSRFLDKRWGCIFLGVTVLSFLDIFLLRMMAGITWCAQPPLPCCQKIQSKQGSVALGIRFRFAIRCAQHLAAPADATAKARPPIRGEQR